MLVKNNILHLYSASIINKDVEGILWVQLTCKQTREMFRVCVCYLPPEGSSRKFDAQDFYDSLLTHIYMYQTDCPFVICGDFNGRVGNLKDFIDGTDQIPDRNVVDRKINRYGELLIDFLVSSNCCMVNGRKGANVFTSVSTKGKAVVDYCIVGHENLHNITDFMITEAKDVYEQSRCIGQYDPTSCCIPDHSLLSWNVTVQSSMPFACKTENEPQWQHENKVYDRNVPSDFGETMKDEIIDLVRRLEDEVTTVQSIDAVYEEFVNIVKLEASKRVTVKTVYNNEYTMRRPKHRNKPWWSDSLKLLWNEVRKCENEWHKSDDGNKPRLKANLRQVQKHFDREVQKAKRKYWFSEQRKLEDSCRYDPNHFWKTIGKVGIAQERAKGLPFEAKHDDGQIVTEKADVLKVWESTFSNLLNKRVDQNNVTSDGLVEQTLPLDVVGLNILDADITVNEINTAINNANKGKASGIDEIHVEFLANENAVRFLHKLFNVCFVNGIFPSMWKKGIICPVPKSNMPDVHDPKCYRGIALAVSSYKLFCSVLNSRLNDWAEQNGAVVEEQNGFRTNRSCIDHIYSLVSIVDTRVRLLLL